MKLDAWKTLACKFLGLVSVLFLFGLLGAVVEGSCSWVLGLFFGLICLVILNSVCGALLPQDEEEEQRPEVPSSPQPTLTLVRGGKVA